MKSKQRLGFAGLTRPAWALIETSLRTHRPSQLLAIFATILGLVLAISISLLVGLFAFGLGILIEFVWGTTLAIRTNRVLVAKGLQRIGVHYLPGFRRFEDRSPRVSHAFMRAWEGHETRGLRVLKEIALDERSRGGERRDATLALADWHLAHGHPEEASKCLDGIRR